MAADPAPATRQFEPVGDAASTGPLPPGPSVDEPAAAVPEPLPEVPVASAPISTSDTVLVTPETIEHMPAPEPPAAAVTPVSMPATDDDPEPEPPPRGGILTGSRIPGVTAHSIPSTGLGGPSAPILGAAQASGGTDGASAGDGFIERPHVFTPPPAAGEPVASEEGVYEIEPEAQTSYESALAEAQDAPEGPSRPSPFAAEPVPADPSPSMIARRPVEILGGVENVEGLLQRAQDEFRAGRRDSASQALVEAALAYERLGRLDSAATIFRSLGRGAAAPLSVMELWLANCEKRGDRTEGALVSCELGDRALNDSQKDLARRWFEHALAIDANCDTARRRLQRLAGTPAPPADPAAAPAAEPATAAPEAGGRVAVAVGRGRAVTFDLQGLLQEFQRGVESQLEGDAQGHYDLGMAYREMGLHDEAIGAFRIAERDPRLTQRAREMVGRSLADSERHDEAVREFESALQVRALDAEAEAELRFQMALSLSANAQPADALAQLEIADMRFPGRSDIQQRLVEWRRAFGQAA